MNRKFISMLPLLAVIMMLISCGGSSNSDKTASGPGDPAQVSAMISETLFPVPATLTGADSFGKKNTALQKNSGIQKASSSAANPEFAGWFLAVRDQILFCDEIKQGISDGLAEIFSFFPEAFANPGTKISWDEDEESGSFLVEKNTDSEYQWKITVEWDEPLEKGKMIIRYTMVGDAIKGEIIQYFNNINPLANDPTMTEFDIDDDGSADFDDEGKAVITFDGTGSEKTFEIKMIRYQDKLTEYFSTNWDLLIPAQKQKFYAQGPQKLIMKVTKTPDGATINGSMYLPLWNKWNTAPFDDYTAASKIDAPLFSYDRYIYTFRGRSVDNLGSRIDVAFPLESGTIESDFWISNGFGNVLMQYYPDSYQLAENISFSLETEEANIANLNANYFPKIINSAFFNTSGFIGFYDDTNFYVSTDDGKWPLIGLSTVIDPYKSIIVSDIQAIPPSEIVNLTITVE